MGVTEDASRLRMSLAAAEAKAAMLDVLPTPVIEIAKDYTIAYMNPAGAALFGVNRQHVVGMNSHNVLRTAQCHAGQCLCQQTVMANSRVSGETVLDPGGLNLPIQFTGAPVEDGAGHVIGTLVTFTDLRRERELADEVLVLKTALLKGDFTARGNPERFDGNARTVVQSLNEMLDGMTRPLDTITAYAEALARGVMPEKIADEYPGKLGDLRQAMNRWMDTIRDVLEETNKITGAIAKGKFERRADLAKYKGQWGLFAKGLNDAIDALLEPIRELSRVLEKLAAGNFKVRVTSAYQGDYQALKTACNDLGNQLQGVQETVEHVRYAITKGQLTVRGETRQLKGDFASLVQGGNDIAEAMCTPILTMADYIQRIASGALPGRIIDEYKGNFNDIKNSLNSLLDYQQELIHAAEAIATGDLSTQITPRSERDLPTTAFLRMRDAIQQCITELHNLIGAIIEGRLNVRGNVASLQGDFTRVVRGVNLMLDAVVGPLHLSTQYIERIASGNIPAKLIEDDDGEFNEVRVHINHCIDTLNTLIGDVSNMADAAAQGNWDYRVDGAKYEGEWAVLAKGLNTTAEQVSAAIQDVGGLLHRLAGGEFEVRLTHDYKGDYTILKTACNDLAGQLSGMQHTVEQLHSEITNGQLNVRGETQHFNGQFAGMVQHINLLLDTLHDPLRGIIDYVAALAAGDVPEKLSIPYKGDFNTLKNHLHALNDTLRDVTAVAEQVAAGNLSFTLRERSNRDGLSRAFNTMQAVLRNVVNETQRQALAVQEGRLGMRGSVTGVAGNWRDLLTSVNRICDMFMVPLNVLNEYVNRLACGDIPDKIAEEFRGEFNGFRNTMNRLLDEMSDIKALAREITGGNIHLNVQERSEKDDLMRTFKEMVAAVQALVEAPETQAKRWQIPLPQATDQDGALGQTLRQMVANFQEMMEEMEKSMQDIQQQHWRSSGLVDLEAILRESGDSPTLAKELITFLVKYVKAHVGAIYLAHEVKDETILRLTGSYAYSVRKGNKAEFALGEGLIGQAALEKETILFSEVPDHYILSSGLGRTPLRFILVMPFLQAGEIVGVLELGTAHEFSEAHMAFLKQACESIAAAFRKARRDEPMQVAGAILVQHSELREHQQQLRDQQAEVETQMHALQESKQKLRQQEEELRDRYTELSTQSASLRESEQTLQQRQEQLRLRHEELENQAKALRESEQLLRQQQQQVQARYGELESQGAYLRQANQKRQYHEEQLHARYEALQAQANVLRESEQNLQTQREKLRKHYEELEARARTIRESERQIQQQREHLRKQYEEVESRATTLQEFEQQLRQQNEKLKEKDVALAQRVQELEAQQQELHEKQAKLDQARELVQAKIKELESSERHNPEMLVKMASTLRSPLNRLLIVSNLLVENKEHTLTEKQLEFARTINSSATKLLALINEVLHLAKIETGKIDITVENLSLRGLKTYIEQHFTHPAQEKNLTLQVDIAENLPVMIRTARQHVETILKHLLSNAIKFTERGQVSVQIGRPSPEIRLSQKDLSCLNTVAIAITDTGFGISEAQQQVIFDAFQQGEPGSTRKSDGIGLGLAVARGLAQALGGEIQVQSTLGKGSVFTLYLPESMPPADHLAIVPEPAEETPDFAEAENLPIWIDNLPVLALPEQNSDYDDTPLTDIPSAPEPGDIATPPTIEEPALKAFTTFLMVAANPTLQGRVTALVKGHGGAVTCVNTAQEAYRALQTSRFDGMIVSWEQTTHIGQDVLEMIAEDALMVPLPVLVYAEKPLSPGDEQRLRGYSKSPVRAIVTSPEQLIAELAQVLPTAEPELQELQDEVSKELQQVEELVLEQQNELRLFRSKDAVLNRRSILVVGRDRGNVYTVTNVLQEKGLQVLFAENGHEALKQLESHPGIDLVLMENMLAEVEGFKVTREIRRQRQFTKLPVIALMTKARPEDYQRCLDAGVNDYLAKPVDTDELLSLLRVWLY